MLTRRIDSREKTLNPITISYLIQTANQFACDIYVSNEKDRANLKQYDEMKNLKMGGFLTFYFKGSDETEAEDRIHRILWQDN